MIGPPDFICSLNFKTTDPEDPSTFPNLTIEKFVYFVESSLLSLSCCFEYALTTPFTVSTASFSSGEDCDFTSVRADDDSDRTQDLKFNSDGTAVFVALRDDGILNQCRNTL